MHTLYKIHKNRLMLNPKNAKPFITYASIKRAVIKLKCDKVGNKYIVLDSQLQKWNQAVKFINGLPE